MYKLNRYTGVDVVYDDKCCKFSLQLLIWELMFMLLIVLQEVPNWTRLCGEC